MDVPRSQRTPMGNPYISLYSGCLWVIIPNKYHGYTVRGTPNCPLIITYLQDVPPTYIGVIIHLHHLLSAMDIPVVMHQNPGRFFWRSCFRFLRRKQAYATAKDKKAKGAALTLKVAKQTDGKNSRITTPHLFNLPGGQK